MNSPNKNIKLTYFAFLKEIIGIDSETIVTSADTVENLYNELRVKYNIESPLDSIKVAVNDVFSSWQTKLKNNDHVVFIPPVAGG